MYRRTLLGLCVALLTAACGSHPPTQPGPIVNPPPDNQPPPPPTPTLGITRILCFGDSMTEGTTSPVFSVFALTAGQPWSYPFKLQTLATARYTAQTIAVSNAGKAGENATGTSPSPRDRLSGAMSEAKPELLVLMEGANDLNLFASTGVTDVSKLTGAMEDMVRDAMGRGIQVIVATLPPQRAGGPKAGAGPLLGRYNNELKAMAQKKGAMLVDVNALLPLTLIGQDGLHPTEEGYQRLAEVFMEAIKAKYEVSASVSQ